MLLRAKILNKEEIWREYARIRMHIDDPTKKDLENINLKDLSCELCRRFLIEPVKHPKCERLFCRTCFKEWIKVFGFCNRCNTPMSEEEVEQMPLDEEMLGLLKMIRIDCRLGNCVKRKQGRAPMISVSNLPTINEANFEEEEMPMPQMKVKKQGSFWDFFLKRGEKEIFEVGEEGDEAETDLKSSINFRDTTLNHSSESNYLNGSVRAPGERKTYNVAEYPFHLMRNHFWPKLDIRYDKKFNSLAFAGFRNDKKLGPGVVYYVDKETNIRTNIGAFEDNILNREVTIIQNNRLVYDGAIQNGKYHGFGTLRHYIQFQEDMRQSGIRSADLFCFLEYKGRFVKGKRKGKGKLYLYGNMEKLKSYFDFKNGMHSKEINGIEDFRTDQSVVLQENLDIIRRMVENETQLESSRENKKSKGVKSILTQKDLTTTKKSISPTYFEYFLKRFKV